MPSSHRQSAVSRGSWKRIVSGVAAGTLALTLGAAAAFKLSPAPGAMLIRAVFKDNDRKITAALQKHTPRNVASFLNEAYRPDDSKARLDVFVRDSAVASGEALPTVVWMHGGAWVAGSKEEWAPYFMVLAERGYTVVAIGYSLGPGATYPTALHQLNDALAYIGKNAKRLHVDPHTIVLAGDSAGAQITSQYATVVTSSAYADLVKVVPSLSPARLRGVIFYCGIYDFVPYFTATGLIGWGTRVAVWGYTGSRGTTSEKNPALIEMSTLDHITADFPPSFISGGNTDPLTEHQSKPLAAKLQRLGVDTTTLFFPQDHEPGLGHEYQFNLDCADGQEALERSVQFLQRVLPSR